MHFSTHHNYLRANLTFCSSLDAKRDLSDLGMDTYAEEKCFLLGKLPYDNLSKEYPEGVMFATYQTLIGKNKGKKTRLDQLIQWCGGENFDGLIM